MNIRIERVSEDKLSRTIWEFYFSCDTCSRTRFILDEYREQCRETIRKRTWRDNKIYLRIGDMRGRTTTAVPVGEVPLPDDIVAEAKGKLVGAIQALPVERIYE